MFNEREMHEQKLLLPTPAFYQDNYISQLRFCANERFLKDRLQLQLSFVQVVHFCENNEYNVLQLISFKSMPS